MFSGAAFFSAALRKANNYTGFEASGKHFLRNCSFWSGKLRGGWERGLERGTGGWNASERRSPAGFSGRRGSGHVGGAARDLGGQQAEFVRFGELIHGRKCGGNVRIRGGAGV
jgi:hypothetical protein